MPTLAERSKNLPAASPGLQVACGLTLATLVPVLLYQTKVIATLPDPPLDIFASAEITSSPEAHPFGIPDAVLGLGSFGATMLLAVASDSYPAARPLLGAKLILDGAAATINSTRQIVTFGKLCSWCTATALAAACMVYAGRAVVKGTLTVARDLVR